MSVTILRDKPSFLEHIMSLSREAWSVIRRVHNELNVALWAVGVAGMVYLLLHIPEMQDARARADAQLAQQISDENKSYCVKWGMPAGTHEHVICTMDLVRIRQETEERVEFFLPMIIALFEQGGDIGSPPAPCQPRALQANSGTGASLRRCPHASPARCWTMWRRHQTQ